MLYLIRNEKWYTNLGIFFISLLPAALLFGSAIINIFIFFIIIFFIINTKINKTVFSKDLFFYLLLAFWASLFINFLFSNFFLESMLRAIGFGRFILLIYAIKYFFSYKKFKFEKLILKFWLAIFFIVTADLMIEFFYGHNSLGFKSDYPGRLSGFLNDELKIGNYYWGFLLISISTILYLFKNEKLYVYVFSLIFLFVSFLIGERAAFSKVFFILMSFFIISKMVSKKKIFLIFLTSIIFIFATIKFNNHFYSRINDQVLNPVLTKGYSNYLKEIQHGAHRNAAKLIFKDNFYFGSGLKTFRFESIKKKYENKEYQKTSIRNSTHPHQVHWEIISETGIFGYSSFVFFFMLIFFYSIKDFLRSRNLFTLSSLLFILSTLLPIIPSGSFFTTYGATIFWINFSLLIVYKQKS